MKTYTVISKTEHSQGFAIHLSVVNEAGQSTAENINIVTTDKAYSDSFIIGSKREL